MDPITIAGGQGIPREINFRHVECRYRYLPCQDQGSGREKDCKSNDFPHTTPCGVMPQFGEATQWALLDSW